MSRRMRIRVAAGCRLGMLLFLLAGGVRGAVFAQQAATPASVEHELQKEMGADASPRGLESPALAQHRLLMMERARYQEMRADADRLEQLAAELKASRAGAAGAYTAAELRLLAEIEKLAHRIQETMRAEGPAAPVDLNLLPTSVPGR